MGNGIPQQRFTTPGGRGYYAVGSPLERKTTHPTAAGPAQALGEFMGRRRDPGKASSLARHELDRGRFWPSCT
jgi:hypothetical protein